MTPHLTDLEKIAERRLRQSSRGEAGQRLLARADAMDYVLQAICLVLAGSRDPHSGRKTRRRHLQNLRAFRYHVQNVLSSHISHELERVRRQGEHLPIGPESPDSPYIDPPAAVDVVREVCLRETRQELFTRLWPYTKGRPEMMGALELWRESWPTDDPISNKGVDPKEVYELRLRARKALGEMARREGPGYAHGREIFGP